MTAEAVFGPVDIENPFAHLQWDDSGPDAYVLVTPQERAKMQLGLEERDQSGRVTQEHPQQESKNDNTIL